MIKGLLNLLSFLCLLAAGISVLIITKDIIKKITGVKEVTLKTGELISINNVIKNDVVGLIVFSVFMILTYGFANDWHTPSEVSKIVAEQEAIEKQRKAEEKVEKERKKKEELEAQERELKEREAKIAQEKLDKENADKNDHDYMEININTLLGDLEGNAARAKKNYEGRYVKIVGAVVKNIESDGDYINIDTPSGIGLRAVQCFPKYQSTKEQIFNLNNEQYLTVYGRITHVGEVVGYSLDLLKIE